MVYAAAYCPLNFKPTLESLGFDGEFRCHLLKMARISSDYRLSYVRFQGVIPRHSGCTLGKHLYHHTSLLFAALLTEPNPISLSPKCFQDAFTAHPSLVYSSTTLSPQDISSGMLRRSPFNLNRRAEEATIGLIREALARGVNLKEVSRIQAVLSG